MNDLKKYSLKEKTLDKFKSCFDLNGSPKKKENIQWQFFKNTESNNFVDIAFDEKANKTAGIYAVSCVKFKINDEKVLGTQSLDTITDKEYRGKGLFTGLAKSVYDTSKNNGTALVYGFPNGNSIYAFQKKLDWQVLDPVPFLIKPLRTKYFINKIKYLRFLPNIKLSYSSYRKNEKFLIKEENSFPEEVNSLWEKFSSHFKVAVIRSQEYLNWRYLKKPNENYKIAHCHSETNEYLGYIIFTIKKKHNGIIGYIMELVYNTDNLQVGKKLLNYAIDKINKEKADCILAWSLEHSPNHKVFKRKRFLNMPEKLRPIELHFGARSFNSEIDEIIYNRDNWYISYSDSDTV